MSDLTNFLLARIAEDEAQARAAKAGPWGDEFGGVVSLADGHFDDVAAVADLDIIGIEGYTYGPEPQERETAHHIARWDPVRVLAECEAKRQIVELHEDAGASQGYTDTGYGVIEHCCGTCGSHGEYGEPWPCDTLRLLACPYADHPDYRDEWRV